ncbi:hypothetical protein AAMO2058_000266300 [Amorphochlora amoebiformis]
MSKESKSSMEAPARWCFGCARPFIGTPIKGEKDDPQFLKVLLLGNPMIFKEDAYWPDVEPFKIVKKKRKSVESPEDEVQSNPMPTSRPGEHVPAITDQRISTSSDNSATGNQR